MGNITSRTTSRDSTPAAAEGRGSKRPRESEDSNEEPETQETCSAYDMNTPKRRRIRSTSKYIYDTLFLSGKDSDVTIVALGKEWKLHKLYLSQSGYFASMFSGSWEESSKSLVKIEIPDENITEDALKIAFGSMYKDDILVRPRDVMSVLAAANLLQLDGLLQHCEHIMMTTVGSETVCDYYYTTEVYGTPAVKTLCFQWLLRNITNPQNHLFLRQINEDLLIKVITSPDLWVIQVEMDVYSVVKRWMFMMEHPTWSGTEKDFMKDYEVYLKKRVLAGSRTCFLATEEGSQYIKVFKCLRWQHMVTDHTSLNVLRADKIVPLDWLEPVFRTQWMQMLSLEQKGDEGPHNVNEETFLQHCMRCGRVLMQEQEYCWRWVGYTYGFDLLITHRNRTMLLKRNSTGYNFPGSISMQDQRSIKFRMTVASMDKHGHPKLLKKTVISLLTFTKDEERMVMILDKELTFPLHVLTNILYYTPHSPSPPRMLDGPISRECSTQTDKCPAGAEERGAGFERPVASSPPRAEVACQTVTASEGRVETKAGSNCHCLSDRGLRGAPAAAAVASAAMCSAAHGDKRAAAGVAREVEAEAEAEREADVEGEAEADVEADCRSEAEVEDEADIAVAVQRTVQEKSVR